MDLAQAELDEYLKNQNAEKKKLEETRRKVEDSSKLAAERESGVQELRQSIPRMEEEVRKASVELAEVTEKEKNLSDALNRNRTKFSEAQNSFSKNRNRSRVLNFLMQMRAEGKLTGVYGRLGDLAAIDEKYDIAISTACGPLDNIVVDSIDTAQRCVELLKSSNTGSATFLALDKQEKWREHVNRKFTA
jgi:structural maintenance of chromosome 4